MRVLHHIFVIVINTLSSQKQPDYRADYYTAVFCFHLIRQGFLNTQCVNKTAAHKQGSFILWCELYYLGSLWFFAKANLWLLRCYICKKVRNIYNLKQLAKYNKWSNNIPKICLNFKIPNEMLKEYQSQENTQPVIADFVRNSSPTAPHSWQNRSVLSKHHIFLRKVSPIIDDCTEGKETSKSFSWQIG